MTTDTFIHLQSEAHKSALKYTSKLWSTLTMRQMFIALIGEAWELGIAFWRRDVHGPHGILIESVHVANVAIRINEEIARRFGGIR